jgi:predicted fused transcriptional regulator/phosphomethylpyrimidine kinase
MERKLLLTAVALQLAVIVALVGGIVKKIGGAPMTGAIQAGAASFAATFTLTILFLSTVGLV